MSAPSLPVALDDVRVEIAGRTVVRAVTMEVEAGGLVAIIGPNGCGKTTLLRTVYRALRPAGGRVSVGDRDVWQARARESARLTAMVAQVETDDFEFRVRETVTLGRVPHHGLLSPHTQDDDDVVDAAMATAGVSHLAGRMTHTLSGGERQRVALARALAQQTPVVVLDEPTNHLDVRARIELLELLAAVPATVVAVLHDLDLAAAYADRLFVMSQGCLVAHGPPVDVLTPGLLADVYGVQARLSTNPITGRPALHVGLPAATSHAVTTTKGPTP